MSPGSFSPVASKVGDPTATTSRAGVTASPSRPQLVLIAPLRIEALALRRGARRSRVERVGMGMARAQVACARLSRVLPQGAPVGLLGMAGAVDPSLRAGDLVVATELRTTDGSRPPVTLDPELAERVRSVLSRSWPRTRSGTVICSPRLVGAAERAELAGLAGGGALVCEMESAWLAPLREQRPFVVVRAVVDRPGFEIASLRTISAGLKAWRRLAAAATAVEQVLSTL
ncbi:MAG: hypothetical protein ACRDZP_09725 [Acidimicrobiales bacterium]